MANEPAPLSQVFLAALIGVGISVGCLMVPLVHIVSGPLGPAIGGFVSGSRVRASGSRVGILGICIGCGMALVFAGIAALLLVIAPNMWKVGTLENRYWFWGLTTAIWAYGTTVGCLGAWLGGRAGKD